MSSLLLFFAHDMQVEVPEGTVLCFNPLSLSSDELSALPDIQVCVGGSSNSDVTFQTKQAVLDNLNVSSSFFDAQHSFELQTGQSNIEEAPIKRMMIEFREGLEFFSLLFDYLRRKYDHDYSNANDNDNHNDNNDNDNHNDNNDNDKNDKMIIIMIITNKSLLVKQ